MDMQQHKDFFEEYLNRFPDTPSLVIVRSVELKNFPRQFLNHPILDLCCGDGFFAKTLGLKNIYGCDIDSSALKRGEETYVYKELKLCDARDLSLYPNSYFKTVLSNCALEHVDEINVVLLNIYRVLAEGGHLIMSVPSELLLTSFPPKKILVSIGFEKWGDKLLYEYNKKQTHKNICSYEKWKKAS